MYLFFQQNGEIVCLCPFGECSEDENVTSCTGDSCEHKGQNITREIVGANLNGITPSKHCLTSPCLNGGECAWNDLSSICVCKTGFTGDTCQINIDECNPEPCIHGVCEDQVGAYQCVCDTGYEGKLCDTNIDDCSNDPCVQGYCVDLLDDYQVAPPFEYHFQ